MIRVAGSSAMRRMSRLYVVAALGFAALTFWAAPVAALDPSERLKDSALELRARDLSTELRCLVCQNQSIDDSDAPLARDLRRLVRERLVAGDSNAEVKSFLVARYGDFVLLKPPFGLNTLLLWLAPLLVLVAAVVFVMRIALRSPRVAAERATASRLTAEEERRLADLMQGDEAKGTRTGAGPTPAGKG